MLDPNQKADCPAHAGCARVTQRSVLLLDDEEAILVPAARYFRNLGFAVDTAREVEEAEALMQDRCYDVAVLDLRVGPIGGSAGLDVLRELRRQHPTTSVIVLSAYISPEVEAEAWALGASRVLCKPQPLSALAHLACALVQGVR